MLQSQRRVVAQAMYLCLYKCTYCTLYRPEVVSGAKKQVLWYAIVLGQPNGTRDLLKNSSALLVAEMATTDLSVESAILFMRELRRQEKEVFKNNVQPNMMSDKR